MAASFQLVATAVPNHHSLGEMGMFSCEFADEDAIPTAPPATSRSSAANSATGARPFAAVTSDAGGFPAVSTAIRTFEPFFSSAPSPPLAPGLDDAAEGVVRLPQIVRPLRRDRPHQGEAGGQKVPLGTRDIARVRLPCRVPQTCHKSGE